RGGRTRSGTSARTRREPGPSCSEAASVLAPLEGAHGDRDRGAHDGPEQYRDDPHAVRDRGGDRVGAGIHRPVAIGVGVRDGGAVQTVEGGRDRGPRACSARASSARDATVTPPLWWFPSASMGARSLDT